MQNIYPLHPMQYLNFLLRTAQELCEENIDVTQIVFFEQHADVAYATVLVGRSMQPGPRVPVYLTMRAVDNLTGDVVNDQVNPADKSLNLTVFFQYNHELSYERAAQDAAACIEHAYYQIISGADL